ncbi:MAG: hypothetical protein KF787_03220 [Phycisphaeraceae bacterium]|nr:hypothetical protein [Phycisphaerae bacterium]MBX3391639.1 hypothetical protein [Phycisphaeraceae bacterium]
MPSPIEISVRVRVMGSIAELLNKGVAWGLARGFEVDAFMPTLVRLRRGHWSASLWAFDIRHYPTTITISTGSEQAAEVDIVVRVDPGFAFSVSDGDREQIKSLLDAVVTNLGTGT